MVRTLIATLGRPTIANAMLWSLGLHLGAAAASYYSWTRSLDRMSLAGMRNVVQVELSIATETLRAQDDVAVPIEFEPVPPVTQQQEVWRSPRETLVQIQRLPIPPVRQETRARQRPVSAREPSLLVPSADSVEPVRREPIDMPPDSGDSTPPPLQPREFKRPQISVAAAQIAGVDETFPPELLDNAPPDYPAEAIARNLEGTVLLRLHIAASGMVERVEVVTSSGHDVLDSAAVEAVSQWRARPAHRAGIAVATVELLPVRFRL
jgi:periplasmic protein TonB